MDSVLILTPVKDAFEYLDDYFARLSSLSYPLERVSVGVLESDSLDGTFEKTQALADQYGRQFASIQTFKYDFGFRMPKHIPRWEAAFQLARRNVLARSRNQLLFRALTDQDWVLWLDVDVISYPHDLIETLIGYDLDILHPECVQKAGGPSFDLNAWKDNGELKMQDLRGSGAPVRIDSVGGTVLLVKADVHRSGAIFPPFKYGTESPSIRNQHPIWGKGEIETEGFAAMAKDIGFQSWGLPDLEVIHA